MVSMLEASRWGGKALPGQDDLPYDDGEPVETGFHHAQPSLLIDSLSLAWAERTDFYCAGNMFVYFSEHQIRSNDFRGPDLFVVLGAERKPRKSWVAWEEGGRMPDVVIEITSPSTASLDRGEKKQLYARIWRTAAYFIFDPDSEQLEAYRLDNDRLHYVAIPPNGRGDYAIAAMGLALGLRPTRYREYDRLFLRWIDADGKPLPFGAELYQQEHARAERERLRAEQERARAERAAAEHEQALERIRALEEQLATLERKP